MIFNSIWDDASLVKRAPEYAKSIHKFYEMLKYFDELDAQQIKLLQRVNLFLVLIWSIHILTVYQLLYRSTKIPLNGPVQL